MKTFLFPTDFSENATHALDYGYSLAKQVKANVIICNATTLLAEMPQAGFVTFPAEVAENLLNDSEKELARIKCDLQKDEKDTSFNPVITSVNTAATVIGLTNHLSNYHDIGLVIIGTHGSSGLSTLLLGNHSREMIDEISRPLLLVPPAANIAPIKKIAFATDFKNPAEDLECIYKLIELARPLHAEILITNILTDDQHDPKSLTDELSNKANYPLIYYRVVKARTPIAGLDWLCEHGHIDILAMVHRSHNFIDSMFRGSQTQKMAKHIPIPLLVFPSND
ncbi:universal stress protein [Mucilaginibacter antarcticus]|uniref:Universal stress protein n=1 Tax=Mucilaginibacter antarcticus TaxID=1855725 RepID=A0ABW5XS35_9SPHI